VASFAVSGVCAALYPTLRSLGLIIALGTVEACAYVLIEPTMFAVISDSTNPQDRGRAMGIGGLFQFGGMAFGALVLGALYGVGEGISFWGAAGVLVAAAVVCAFALPPRSPQRPSVHSERLAMNPLES
jgi:MFS family permease